MRIDEQTIIDAASSTFQFEGPVLRFDYQGKVSVETPQADARPSSEEQPTRRSRTRKMLHDVSTAMLRLDRFGCLPFPNGSARTVLCSNTLPFVDCPDRVIAEFRRVLADDGLLMINANVPQDATEPVLWRPSPQGLARLLAPFECMVIGWLPDENDSPTSLFAIVGKAGAAEPFSGQVQTFMDKVNACVAEAMAPAEVQPTFVNRLANWLQCFFKSNRDVDAPKEQTQREMEFLVHAPVHDLAWLAEWMNGPTPPIVVGPNTHGKDKAA